MDRPELQFLTGYVYFSSRVEMGPFIFFLNWKINLKN